MGMTPRAVFITLIILWLVFAAMSLLVPAGSVFHCLNAIIMSAGVSTIWVYGPGMRDAWLRRYDGITAAHWLTLGVCVNWLGIIVRLGRWYFTDATPADTTAQWAYNIGLWVSVTGAWLLIGAATSADPAWTKPRLIKLAGAFVAVAVGLMVFDDYNFSHFP